MLIHVIFHAVARPGPLDGETMSGFGLYLLAVPWVIHLCQGMSPERGMRHLTPLVRWTTGKS